MACLRHLFMLAALLGAALPAQAWNAGGHRLSALLAWQQLDEKTRDKVGWLLARHPEYGRWLARGTTTRNEHPPALIAFLEASTWPDDLRHDRRFEDGEEEEPSGGSRPDHGDRHRHRSWHFTDRPLDGRTPHTPRGRLEQQLQALPATLASRSASIGQRSYALPWLIHLVADAHQPLHAASRYDEDGDSDIGGNRLTVETPGHPRLRSMSLHRYWDDLPGPPWLRGEALERRAAYLRAQSFPVVAEGNAGKWLEESWFLAQSVAYPENAGEGSVSAGKPVITADFHARARAVADERIFQAGDRLAATLRRSLKNFRVPANP